MGVKFPGKKRYVTLEWRPLRHSMREEKGRKARKMWQHAVSLEYERPVHRF